MEAFTVNRYGKREILQLTNFAEPILKDNDVLIQVYGAGVNLLDLKIGNGEFKRILPNEALKYVKDGHTTGKVVIKIK